jgi:NAD(P)-dependent dehydrogenase (short-subunit alcohol dehydrogenase family)
MVSRSAMRADYRSGGLDFKFTLTCTLAANRSDAWETGMTLIDRVFDDLQARRMSMAGNSAPPSQSFAGRRVVITGGTAGLGLALVRELLGRGADVAFVARKSDGVVRVAQEFGRPHGVIADVSRKEEIHRIALQVLGALGGVDVLINNASDLGPIPLQLLADTECEDFERALMTNVMGPFRLTKALLGSLAGAAREKGGAVVLNVSSDAAVTPYARWGAYGASKAALQHLTRIWEQELASSGIRFISVDPGDMDTTMHAAAVPGADVSALKRPEVAAREVADVIAAALPVSSSEIGVTRLAQGA